jgi:heptosyltransferase I
VKRLLVVRLSALGDVIHTLPAVAALKAHARITWVVESPYRELVELVAGVQTVPVRMKQWARHPSAMRDAVRQMRGFDESIDFQGLIKSAILPWVAGVPRRIGFAKAAIREKPALLFLNETTPVETSAHVIEQNLQLAARVGPRDPGSLSWDAFTLPVPGTGGDVVLLPGAGKANKLWPVERFRELATRIGPKALAVWGPGESQLAEAIGARVAPPTSLRQLAGVLQSASVVIGADTGPLHLAAALGTPVIGLYGPTDPRRNGPHGQLDRVIDRFPSTKSMESISVNEVMESLERVVRP